LGKLSGIILVESFFLFGVLFYYYDIKKELSFLHSKEEILFEFKIIFVGMTGVRFVLCFYFPNSGYIKLLNKTKN